MEYLFHHVLAVLHDPPTARQTPTRCGPAFRYRAGLTAMPLRVGRTGDVVGYQVLKKWLSYRESRVLGRPRLLKEGQHFTDTAPRVEGILLVNAVQ